MALSEREQQMLEEMEQALYAEDPRFATSMKGGPLGGDLRRRRIIGAVGVVAGLGLVLLGVSTSVWVGVVGFVVIVASLAVALTPRREGGLQAVQADGSLGAPRKPGGRVPRGARTGRPAKGAARPGRAARPQKSGTFMQRLEQRWEQRRHGGSGY